MFLEIIAEKNAYSWKTMDFQKDYFFSNGVALVFQKEYSNTKNVYLEILFTKLP